MVHPIKAVYNFVVTIQVICLIIFFFDLVENDFDLRIPITIDFGISAIEPIKFTVFFTWGWLLAIIIFVFALFLFLNLNVVGTGLNDQGGISLKMILSFITKFFILFMPMAYLLGRSDILNQYYLAIAIFTLLIHILNLLIDVGQEQSI
jgi:hypothetical protein